MSWFFLNLSTGIAWGMILFLIGAGFSLTLGTMGILNLTHGAFFVIGGFVGYTLVKAGVNFWLAALIAATAAGLVGLAIERTGLSRLYKKLDPQMLLTLGCVSIIGNLALWWGGSVPQFITPPSF